MKDQNLYYLIILELGITILDNNNKIISFIKFKDPNIFLYFNIYITRI